jgi:hypothetical protein
MASTLAGLINRTGGTAPPNRLSRSTREVSMASLGLAPLTAQPPVRGEVANGEHPPRPSV